MSIHISTCPHIQSSTYIPVYTSTINKFDKHITGMNDNINKELRNIHNWVLVQMTKLKYFQNYIYDVTHATKNVPSLKLLICNLKIEEVDHFKF